MEDRISSHFTRKERHDTQDLNQSIELTQIRNLSFMMSRELEMSLLCRNPKITKNTALQGRDFLAHSVGLVVLDRNFERPSVGIR